MSWVLNLVPALFIRRVGFRPQMYADVTKRVYFLLVAELASVSGAIRSARKNYMDLVLEIIKKG